MYLLRVCGLGALAVAAILSVSSARADNDVITNFPEADVNIGERLFLETRFAQYFFTNAYGDANATGPADPTVATLTTTNGLVPGPFAGMTMNCRQCHIVDEMGYGPFGNGTLGNRTYADFARRTPVPLRDDGRVQTPRNSPTLVDSFIPRSTPLFLHLDGQFATVHDLIIATMTGRNYGWKPDEYAAAVHHIATIIREDDGTGYLATQARGGRFRVGDTDLASYPNIFAGFIGPGGNYIWDPRTLTPDLVSPQYQLDVNTATDDQILDAVAGLIETYLRNLFFSQTTNGLDFFGNGTPIFNGSPFDTFLIKNNLPQYPGANESPAQYSRRLLKMVNELSAPQYVSDPEDGSFTTQVQSFTFGPLELQGLKIFLAERQSPDSGRRGGVGNCAACHALPVFTDFIFHNTGAAQEEYDSIHGAGSFARIKIPGLLERESNYDAYLPPTTNHPDATGFFESPPTNTLPGQVDLGAWNVYANYDFPAPQPSFAQIVPLLLGIPQPRLEFSRMEHGQFIIGGSGGSPGVTYYLMTAANPSLPLTNWTTIATNKFDSQGRFAFATPASGLAANVFYAIARQAPFPDVVLPQMIARFKTPTLRDLGQSAPYLHTGRMDAIENVLTFYQQFSELSRQGKVRNADPELLKIQIENPDIAPLAAFIRALNEDYTD